MASSIYLFSELYLAAGNQDREALLEEVFKVITPIHKGDYHWGLTDVRDIVHQNYAFKTGHLTKFRLHDEQEVVNLETKTIELEETDLAVKAKSRFFLHLDSWILAYHPSHSDIMPDQFGRMFSEILMSVHDRFFVDASVDAITDEQDLLELIPKFTKINKIEINLRPANPHPDREFQDIHDRLEELGADIYRELFAVKSARDGKSLKLDDEVYSKLYMALKGYGKGRISGVIDEEKIQISTSKEDQVTSETDHDDGSPSGILEDIFGQFRRLLSNGKGRDQKNS